MMNYEELEQKIALMSKEQKQKPVTILVTHCDEETNEPCSYFQEANNFIVNETASWYTELSYLTT